MIHAKNYKTVTKLVKVMPRIMWPLFFPDTVYMIMYRVGQKSKPDNLCNNFVNCQPIFIFFGTYTL